MKYVFTALMATLIFSNAFSQGAHAVVFTENGEAFTLSLNGDRMNESPLGNVKLFGLTNEFYQARIDFADPGLPDFTVKMFAVKQGFEVTYVIRRNKKGEYVLRYMSESPATGNMSSTNPGLPEEEVRRYAEVDNASEHNSTPGSPSAAPPGNTSMRTATHPPRTGEDISINVHAPGVNMGVNMYAPEITEPRSSEAVPVTETTGYRNPPGTTVPSLQSARSTSIRGNCAGLTNQSTYQQARKTIAEKSFDDTRLTLARQVVKSHCLSAVMIRDLMSIFSFEDSRLQLAKYAVDYCYDPENYFVVNDSFTFESSIDELNEYLESRQ